jgi:hypothetical protein
MESLNKKHIIAMLKESLINDLWIVKEHVNITDNCSAYYSPIKDLDGHTLKFIYNHPDYNDIGVFIDCKNVFNVNKGWWFSDIRSRIEVMIKHSQCDFG